MIIFCIQIYARKWAIFGTSVSKMSELINLKIDPAVKWDANPRNSSYSSLSENVFLQNRYRNWHPTEEG